MSQNSESLFEFDMSNLDDLGLDDLDDTDFNMDLEKVSFYQVQIWESVFFTGVEP